MWLIIIYIQTTLDKINSLTFKILFLMTNSFNNIYDYVLLETRTCLTITWQIA